MEGGGIKIWWGSLLEGFFRWGGMSKFLAGEGGGVRVRVLPLIPPIAKTLMFDADFAVC